MEEPIVTLVVGAALIGLAAGIMEWMLSPLLRAARTSATQRRFMLTDLVWLVLQLQIAMAVVARMVPANTSTTARVWGLVVLCVAALAFWIASLQAVAQAGIRQPLRRAAVFIVVLPGAVAAFIGLPLVALAFLITLNSLGQHPEMSPIGLGSAALQLALGAIGVHVIRGVAAWSVADDASQTGQ